jgi:tetratricopeptide (TPR) repeat protein
MRHNKHLAARALCAAALVLLTASPALAISVEEIVTLVKLEIPDDQIIKKIEKDGSTFKLSPSQILDLKKAGASTKLIRHMLSTSTAGPKKAVVADKKPEREMTAAERAAEDARLREEARRLAEEQRKREEAQRKAFANKVLQKGQALAKAGRFVQAIQIFEKFKSQGVGGMPFAPDSREAYIADYGIANALARAGLYQSAASSLLKIVLAGPDRTFFMPAFQQLRELRRRINYRPPELEDLTQFNVASLPEPFQASFNYFVGEFMSDFGLTVPAVPYLESVKKTSPDHPKARYLLGIIALQDESLSKVQQARAASKHFQEAVVSAEAQTNLGVVDLGYIALARLAYEYGQYDAAIYYYRKISENSTLLADAFYESGWTYFMKNDVGRALGTFQALHSPYFNHRFYPELWILEAAIYVNTCNVESAEKAIKMFRDHVLVLGPPLRDFLGRYAAPEEFYDGFVAAVNTGKGLPRNLQGPVLGDVEFFNWHQTIRQIEREEGIIKANLAALGTAGQDLLARLGELQKSAKVEAGIAVTTRLRAVQTDIRKYHDKVDELEIDIAEQKLTKIEDELDETTKTKPKDEVVRQGDVVIAGSDAMAWPFEGEFWRDEIGAYRSFIPNRCPVETDDGGVGAF